MVLFISLVAAIMAGLTFFVFAYLRRVVPTNMTHIVQTSKKSIPFGRDKPAGNVYYAWPSWLPYLGISVTEFPDSIFQVSLRGYDAYDQARLPFMVDVTAFFRISDAGVAAQRVASFTVLQDDLNAVLQGSVRRVLAINSLENIMQARSELGDQFTKEVQEQIAEWGVLPVKTIEFMDLRDTNGSSVIANVMAKEKSRIERESRVAVADNKRQAELAEIDANRTVEVQRQEAAQLVGQRTAEKDKEVGIANELAMQEIKAAARMTAEREMEVRKVQEVRAEEIAREVAAVNAEKAKHVATVDAQARQTVQVIDAEARKTVQVVDAQAQKEAVVTKAEGELAAALKDADGIKARGEATAAAEQASLMAPVNTQITLAKEIGANAGYQQYLISIKQVEAHRDVGMETARALQAADLKVIANGGDVQKGISSLSEMFTPHGGTQLTGMLSALAQTAEGQQLIKAVAPKLADGALVGAVAGAATGSATAGAIAGAAAQ